jgi:hypothetical protein
VTPIRFKAEEISIGVTQLLFGRFSNTYRNRLDVWVKEALEFLSTALEAKAECDKEREEIKSLPPKRIPNFPGEPEINQKALRERALEFA